MCFSAEVSFGAATVLIPAGGLAIYRAYNHERRYTAIAALPMLFGIQQFVEGLVWMSGAQANSHWVEQASLAYMFFSWLAWPVWVPVSTYFVEPERRKPLYLGFAVAGGMLGGIQYFPYFAHDGWLVAKFLPYAISYEGREILDFLITREATYAIYVAVVIGPLLLSTDHRIKFFGVLVSLVLAVTYFFFSYAYISVFCFGGALMSIYLVWMVFQGDQLSPCFQFDTASKR